MSEIIDGALAHHAEHYERMRRTVADNITRAVQSGKRLFVARAIPRNERGLADIYIDNLPEPLRQVHNCHACRAFIRRFGGLTTLSDDGAPQSVLWCGGDVPDVYAASFSALRAAVERAPIHSAFLTEATQWGKMDDDPWQHLAVTPPKGSWHHIYRHGGITAKQRMQELRQLYISAGKAVREHNATVVNAAVALAESGTLTDGDRFVGPLRWLADLVGRAPLSDGQLWSAVMEAPDDFARVGSSVVGTLLDDLTSGMDTAAAARRFNAKVDPRHYMRAQVAPSAGAIRNAERIFSHLDLAPALARRYAMLDECELVWLPPIKVASASGGVFGHVAPRRAAAAPRITLPPTTMTWAKFAERVLPNAGEITFTPGEVERYAALTTALNPDAAPILSWDRPEHRNPVAWYTAFLPTKTTKWCLGVGKPARVIGVTPLPCLWGSDPLRHLGVGVLLLLEGAKDTHEGHSGLFAVNLRREVHSARSVIEAHNDSSAGRPVGREDASACGIILRGDRPGQCNIRLTVANGAGVGEYIIDRWD